MPGNQRRVGIAPWRTELAALRKRLGSIGHHGRVYRNGEAVFLAAERVRAQHHHGFDGVFAHCVQPVGQYGVKAHTVKVNRQLHQRVS